MEQIKKNIVIIAVVVVALFSAIGYVLWRAHKKAPPSHGLVPQVEIQNNPIENKVPEINPVQKANPFKYQNPLIK